ncbi:MAG: hypothetical protein PWP51_1032 [Clostridiales bacterium]|nr:hypothetical protein [Clostridiales bacterium]
MNLIMELINLIIFLALLIGVPYFMFMTLRTLDRIEQLLAVLVEKSDRD